MNLSQTIETRLPSELVSVMRRTAEIANRRGEKLYLVGGVVRDLLLGRPNVDLDLVVEGDAISLAKELCAESGGKLTLHPRFNTAKLKLDRWAVDIATARSETYARPGALPTVKPGSLNEDLFRRDLTVNALAVRLAPARYGELVDLYGGRADLDARLVRVLHNRSFTDDATRIWRAIRYEQRLGFQMEEGTLKLLKRDVAMLRTINGDRIRHELELVLKEALPEKILRRAWSLKVLREVHPSLRGDAWLAAAYRKARVMSAGPALPQLYLALLTWRLGEEEVEEVITFLCPARQLAVILRDSAQLKSAFRQLDQPHITPAQIHSLLNGYAVTAVQCNVIATESAHARRWLELYLEKLRHVRPALTGDDLKRMGMSPGPKIQALLSALLEARLNGEVGTRADEEVLMRGWIAERGAANGGEGG